MVQDRAGEQRVAEVDPAARPLEQALGRGGAEQDAVQEVPGQPGPGARAQQEQGIRPRPGRLVLLGGGGQQEQPAGVRRKPVKAVRVRGQHALGARQRTGQRGAPGELVRGEAAGEPGQQAGVAGRLPEELGADDRVESLRTAGKPVRATAGALRTAGRPHAAGKALRTAGKSHATGKALPRAAAEPLRTAGNPREPVQQRGRRVVVQWAEAECGQSGEGGAVVRCDQDGDPAARAQSAGRGVEGGPGGRVPGVGVVGADQQRAFPAQLPQAGEQRVGGEAGRGARHGWRARGRAEQDVQAAVGQGAFGGGGGGVQHRAPGPVRGGRLAQQRGPAEAGRCRQHEGAAVALPQPGQHAVQDGEFTAAAVQPGRTVHGRR